jgi:hypothetical protein
MRNGMAPADALAVRPPAAQARLSQGWCVYRGDKRPVEHVNCVDESPTRGSKLKLRRPAIATSVGTGKRLTCARRCSAMLDASYFAYKRLHDKFDAASECNGFVVELAEGSGARPVK